MRILILVWVCLAGLAAPALAADDVAAGQTVIRSQEQAIGRDDAEAAYAFAAPSIRSVFPDADAFMSMVRKSYAPIAHHKSFEFGDVRTVNGRIAQVVHIVDAAGVSWDALYILEQQPDGSMKIVGCMLTKLVDARLRRGLQWHALDAGFADIERHKIPV